MAAEPYPIDFAKYNRGDVVPESVLVRASGLDPQIDHQKYSFWLMGIVSRLKQRYQSEGLGYVSIRRVGNALRILEDGQEQLEYTLRGKKHARDTFLRRHLEQASINAALLTTDELVRHQRSLERDSKLLAFDRPRLQLPPTEPK